MAKRKRFSKAFKQQVVEEFLAGGVTLAQLARRYDISPHLIIPWRKNYAGGRLARSEAPVLIHLLVKSWKVYRQRAHRRLPSPRLYSFRSLQWRQNR